MRGIVRLGLSVMCAIFVALDAFAYNKPSECYLGQRSLDTRVACVGKTGTGDEDGSFDSVWNDDIGAFMCIDVAGGYLDGSKLSCICADQSGYTVTSYQCGCMSDADCSLNNSNNYPDVTVGCDTSTNLCIQCKTDCAAVTNGWVANGTGYQRNVTQQCAGGCAYKYRCADGYYGSTTNGTTGCTKCPEPQDADGIDWHSGSNCVTSTAGSNDDVTACRASTDCKYTDTPGTFNFTNACNASN